MSTLSDENEDVSTQKQLDDVSRDPRDYRATDHFRIRYHRGAGPTSETRTDPHITGDVIDQCIRHGDLKPGHDDCVIFSERVAGVDWHLIANPHTREALTAYAPEHHDHPLSEAEA